MLVVVPTEERGDMVLVIVPKQERCGIIFGGGPYSGPDFKR